MASNQLSNLKSACIRACQILGVDVNFAGFPDNRMDSVDLLDVVKVVRVILIRLSHLLFIPLFQRP